MKKSILKTSWKSILGFGAYGLVLSVGGVLLALLVGGFWGWFGGGFLLFCGLCVLSMGVGGGQRMCTADCPECGGRIGGLDRVKNSHRCCPDCGNYLTGENGELWVTPEGTLADNPDFGAQLGPEFHWPEGCCVCGQPATRRLSSEITVTKLGRSALLSAAATAVGAVAGVGMLVRAGETLQVHAPYCDHHEQGIALEPGEDGQPLVFFRSLAYFRAFARLNSLTPRDRFAIWQQTKTAVNQAWNPKAAESGKHKSGA